MADLLLVVSLFLHPGQEEVLRRFEAVAARITARYGGRIEQVIRPQSITPDGPLPREIHLVRFPGMDDFAAYQADADLAGLAELRQSAITHTTILTGEAGELYSVP